MPAPYIVGFVCRRAPLMQDGGGHLDAIAPGVQGVRKLCVLTSVSMHSCRDALHFDRRTQCRFQPVVVRLSGHHRLILRYVRLIVGRVCTHSRDASHDVGRSRTSSRVIERTELSSFAG